jgi:hypothetical protein
MGLVRYRRPQRAITGYQAGDLARTAHVTGRDREYREDMRMPWSRQPAPENPDPPCGVVLTVNGRAYGCDVLRDPDLDEHGCAAWVAVPAEQVIIREGDSIELTATELPDDTVLYPGITIPGLDEDAWPGSR